MCSRKTLTKKRALVLQSDTLDGTGVLLLRVEVPTPQPHEPRGRHRSFHPLEGSLEVDRGDVVWPLTTRVWTQGSQSRIPARLETVRQGTQVNLRPQWTRLQTGGWYVSVSDYPCPTSVYHSRTRVVPSAILLFGETDRSSPLSKDTPAVLKPYPGVWGKDLG